MGSSRRQHLTLICEDGFDGVGSSRGSEVAVPHQPVVLSVEDSGLARVLDSVERQLDAVLDAGARFVVLDMSAVDRVSSTTVAALLWARRRCSSRGIEVSLLHPSRRCLDALARTGLLEVLAVDLGDGPRRFAGPDAVPRRS
jgi:anti-anti-sigma factor